MLQDAEGHCYRLTQTYKAEPTKKYWRCTWFRRKGLGCKAKAVTHGDVIVKKSCMHNHPADIGRLYRSMKFVWNWIKLLRILWNFAGENSSNSALEKLAWLVQVIDQTWDPIQVFYDTEIQILIADLLQLGLLDGLEMVSRVPGRNIIQDPQGYTYSFMNEYKGSNSSRWRCSRRNKKTKCLAFLVVSDDYILRREHMHICSIDKAEKH